MLRRNVYEKQSEIEKFEEIIQERDTHIKLLNKKLANCSPVELESTLLENRILKDKINEVTFYALSLKHTLC